MISDQNFLIISTDGHCGADLWGYKPYLASRFHDEFDAWAENFSDGWAAVDEAAGDYRVGVASYQSDLNWNSEKRLSYLEREGVVGEVLFPNTAPPFFPAGAIGAQAPATAKEYEYRNAGLQAHNRWLVDFCNATPGRRAGIAQVFLNDVDQALDEIRWAKENGLKGLLLPADHMLQLANFYYPRYEPIWALCEELDFPIHRHGVQPAEAASEENGDAGPAIGHFEVQFFTERALVQFILSGIFERHPGLKFVVTENQAAIGLPLIKRMDDFVRYTNIKGTVGNLFGGQAIEKLKRLPSEYVATNVYYGSFLTDRDIEKRYEVGIDRIMWGADFPHHEGTSPFTHEALQRNFASLPDDEIRSMTSVTATRVYGFDAVRLQRVADKIGVSPAEMHKPADLNDIPEDARNFCPTFAPPKP